jgi:hypothetical protein
VIQSGWVFRLDHEGEILWQINIIGFNVEPPDERKRNGFFTNLTELEDGSILIVGGIDDRFEEGTVNPNLWLLKLDEKRCFFPD